VLECRKLSTRFLTNVVFWCCVLFRFRYLCCHQSRKTHGTAARTNRSYSFCDHIRRNGCDTLGSSPQQLLNYAL